MGECHGQWVVPDIYAIGELAQICKKEGWYSYILSTMTIIINPKLSFTFFRTLDLGFNMVRSYSFE